MIRPSQRHFASENLDPRLRAGLVGHWIGGGSGNTWFDRSGRGHHGALTGGPTWALGEGAKRSALSFSGSFVSVPANTIHDITAAGWSLAAWVRLTDISAFHSIAGKWGGGLGWYVTISNAGKVVFGYAADYYGNKVLTPGQWHHVVCTHDGGTDFRIYVDGVLDASHVRALHTVSGANLDIGRVAVGVYYMAGTLDDVRLYSRALSPAEIALLAQPAFLPVVPRRWFLGPVPSSVTTDATAASATWVAPAATARLRLTTQATAAVSTWTAPAATARTRYTVTASAALSTWVAPSASAQLARRRSIPISGSRSSYSIAGSRASYHIEGS